MKKLFVIAIFSFAMVAATEAFSANYILHLNGQCSQNWLDGKGGGRLSIATGYISINAVVDNTQSVAYSASQFKTKYLDVYCTGSNWCYIVNYSAGDAIMGYINGIYAPSWNVAYVLTSAGASGGSEIAGSFTALFACNITNDLSVSKIRNMYNHNDTNGNIVYRIGGYKGIFGSSLLLPGEDDGAVAYHSAGGCVTAGSYTNLNACTHWTNHLIYGATAGYYLDHYGVKMKFISLLGW